MTDLNFMHVFDDRGFFRASISSSCSKLNSHGTFVILSDSKLARIDESA
jgi:hypothetical protein